MKSLFLFILLFFNTLTFSQIKGKVTDQNGKPLPFVNIYLENGKIGTTSNENGEYFLNLKENNITIIFQSLGYKTILKTIDNPNFPLELNIQLFEENLVLNEVVLTNTDNPANEIIRKAIADKVKNYKKSNAWEADFYSKGMLKVSNVPKKIFGMTIEDTEKVLDSTGKGIVYQSETISKVKFLYPNQIKEHIIASKVAGKNNSFSLNTATEGNFDFYNNFLNFETKIISPIADNAFSFYKYELESSFYDNYKHLINKIKVIPKQDKLPVFEGYIYIVENSWAIYGIDLLLRGYRAQQPFINELKIIQNFNYSDNFWNKNLQTILLKANFLGVKIEGNYSYVYNNYIFTNDFNKNIFNAEKIIFDKNANKKDSIYWNNFRKIPLTEEEVNNYHKKDSIEKILTSAKYLDSIDKKNNKFSISDIIMGYSYQNSTKKINFSYDGLSNLTSINFNSVQGWNMNSGFNFQKKYTEKNALTQIKTNFEYSFPENRMRVSGNYYHLFNTIDYSFLNISGGSKVEQFNAAEPISELINSLSSLFFKDNYMKIYNSEFVSVSYGQELVNGIRLVGNLTFNYRKPLWNTTEYAFLKKDKIYTSNNPLLPNNYTDNFENHYITKLSLLTIFNIKQKYKSYPDKKIIEQDSRYPSFYLHLANIFSSSKKSYQHQTISGLITYNPEFDNKGYSDFYIKGGLFFNAKDISFIDYKHFNGNQTHFSLNKENNSFGLLPYYAYSTNRNFAEIHYNHHFKGFISNKIPLFNTLQWNFVVGFHQLHREKLRPYQEFSIGLENIGWGNFRFLRVDYIRAYQSGFKEDGILFGITF